MKNIELKEILNKYPDEYKVKFYIDDKVYNVEAFGDSPFNETIFLFGNQIYTKVYTKEQLLEQLNKLVADVTNSDKSEYLL